MNPISFCSNIDSKSSNNTYLNIIELNIPESTAQFKVWRSSDQRFLNFIPMSNCCDCFVIDNETYEITKNSYCMGKASWSDQLFRYEFMKRNNSKV